jgi:hypothetical protein
MGLTRQIGATARIGVRTKLKDSTRHRARIGGSRKGEVEIEDTQRAERLTQLHALMSHFNIPIPKSEEEETEALKKLYERMHVEDRHQLTSVVIPEQRSAYSMNPEFFEDYVSQIARLNGRKLRAREKRLLARANPLDDDDIKVVLEYANAGRKRREELQEDVDRIFARNRRQADQTKLTPDRVDTLFPRKAEREAALMPRNVLPDALSRYDLIERAGPLSEDSDVVRKGQRAAKEGARSKKALVGDEAAIELALAEAGLSLTEALSILRQQRAKRSSPYTMQPSTALLRQHKTRRLTTYTPPPEMMARVGDDSVLILLSPWEFHEPRIMTFRRGVHLDADLTSPRSEDAPMLLGRALQASLFWLAEKPGRDHYTVYLGRIGMPTLQRVRVPKQDITLDNVMKAMNAAGQGDPEYDIRYLKPGQENRLQIHVAQYGEALEAIYGRTKRGRSRPTTRRSEYEDVQEEKVTPEAIEQESQFDALEGAIDWD